MSQQNTKQLQDFIVEFHQLYKREDSTLVLAVILVIQLGAQRKGVSLAGKWHNLPEYIAVAQSEFPDLQPVLEEQVEFLRGDRLWEKGVVKAIDLSNSLNLLAIEPAEIGWAILELTSQESLKSPLYAFHQREIAELAVDWVGVGSKDKAYCPFQASLCFAYAFSVKGIPSVFTTGAKEAVAFARLISQFVGGLIEVKKVFEISEHLSDYDPDITFTQGVISPPWGVNVPLDQLTNTRMSLTHALTRSESLFTQYMMSKVTGRCAVIVPLPMLHRTTGGDRSFKEELIKSGKLAAIVQFADRAYSLASSVAPVMLLIDANKQQKTLMVDASKDDFYNKKGRINYFVGKNKTLKAIADEDLTLTKRVTLAETQDNDFNLDVLRYVLSDDAQRLQDKLDALPTKPLHEIVDFVRCQAVKGEALGDIYLEANQADINDTGFFNQPEKELAITDTKIMSRVMRQRMFPGDVLLTTKGNVGKVGLVPDSAEENWFAGQSFIILRLKPGAAIQDSCYLYRYLSSPIAQHALLSKAIGTVIKSIKMNDLEELPVVIPTASQAEEATKKQQKIISLQAQVTNLQQQISELRHDSWLKL